MQHCLMDLRKASTSAPVVHVGGELVILHRKQLSSSPLGADFIHIPVGYTRRSIHPPYSVTCHFTPSRDA